MVTVLYVYQGTSPENDSLVTACWDYDKLCCVLKSCWDFLAVLNITDAVLNITDAVLKILLMLC